MTPATSAGADCGGLPVAHRGKGLSYAFAFDCLDRWRFHRGHDLQRGPIVVGIDMSLRGDAAIAEFGAAHKHSLPEQAGRRDQRILDQLSGPPAVFQLAVAGRTEKLRHRCDHPWVVTDAGGNCLGVHFADVGKDTVTVR